MPPQPLLLWLELKSWNTHQLVPGGLIDQPAFVWDLIQISGAEYETCVREFRKEEEIIEETKRVASNQMAGITLG
jgi:hypothetical protein